MSDIRRHLAYHLTICVKEQSANNIAINTKPTHLLHAFNIVTVNIVLTIATETIGIECVTYSVIGNCHGGITHHQ